MNRVVFLIAVTLLLATSSYAQSGESGTKPEGTKEKPAVVEQEKPESDARMKGFVDTDGDGIDDRTVQQGQQTDDGRKHMRRRKRDHFIDKDGDGINDSRCNGFGLQRKGKGKKRGGGGEQ
ncbi:MAG: hypothetical protein CL946_07570 [Ectothiorhodospiraceae bacterium]|nr:hypothetical protein [Ectothiorhodospiraceae bacterium]